MRRVLLILCITEVTSWGVLYYAFPVLMPTISAATKWPTGTVTAAFSVCQVTAGIVSIPVGRWLDRVGPRLVMTGGSALAAVALLGVALAPTITWFFVAWTAVGAAMSAVLYQPAFTALTRWWGDRRMTALTTLTLVAGLASTVFAPLTAALVGHLGWRGTYVLLAAGLAAITLPAHLFGLHGDWPRSPEERPVPGRRRAPEARTQAFVALTMMMGLGAFAVYSAVVNLVPLLTADGMTTGLAALALGLVGIGQVTGRLGYSRLSAVAGVRLRAVMILGGVSVTLAALAAIPGPTAVLFAAAILAGAARGLFTLLQATAITDRWGTDHYGRLSGLLYAPIMIASAIGPWAGTALGQALGGRAAAFYVLAAAAGLAALLSLISVPAPVGTRTV